ncbi:MAG: hypothetical protein Fur0042_00460 [Cyanophyceae cyanobacterium]
MADPILRRSDRILLNQAVQYRGLLIVPLRLPGDEYSFAIIDPDSWDAADSDGTCYGSIEACLQGGRRRVERYFEHLPPSVHQLLERLEAGHRTAGHPGTGHRSPTPQGRSPGASGGASGPSGPSGMPGRDHAHYSP